MRRLSLAEQFDDRLTLECRSLLQCEKFAPLARGKLRFVVDRLILPWRPDDPEPTVRWFKNCSRAGSRTANPADHPCQPARLAFISATSSGIALSRLPRYIIANSRPRTFAP